MSSKKQRQEFVWSKIPNEIKTTNPEILAKCLENLFDFGDDFIRTEDETGEEISIIYQRFPVRIIKQNSVIDITEVNVLAYTRNQEVLSSFAMDLPVELVWIKSDLLVVCCPFTAALICRFKFDLLGVL